MPASTNGYAIASLVCALLNFFVLPLVGSILGVIFGHIALSQIARAGGTQEGRGLAVGGLVLGYVGLLLAAFYVLVVILTLTSLRSPI